MSARPFFVVQTSNAAAFSTSYQIYMYPAKKPKLRFRKVRLKIEFYLDCTAPFRRFFSFTIIHYMHILRFGFRPSRRPNRICRFTKLPFYTIEKSENRKIFLMNFPIYIYRRLNKTAKIVCAEHVRRLFSVFFALAQYIVHRFGFRDNILCFEMFHVKHFIQDPPVQKSPRHGFT